MIPWGSHSSRVSHLFAVIDWQKNEINTLEMCLSDGQAMADMEIAKLKSDLALEVAKAEEHGIRKGWKACENTYESPKDRPGVSHTIEDFLKARG